MFSAKEIIIFVITLFVFVAVIGLYFYPFLFFQEAPSTTSTTTETVTIPSNATSEFEINPGNSTTLQMLIDSQNFTVIAANKVFPVFGIIFTAPAVTFTDAGKIAYKAAGLNSINEINLQYESGKMVYLVTGYAKDNFQGFDVENLRTVKISDSGNVISITKEPLFISFFKTLFNSVIET